MGFLKMVKDCIVGSAYTYKVQVGYTVIRIRKEGTIRKITRYVYSKSTIHCYSMHAYWLINL